jgi:HAD superfamily hydrolase (TIGR01509 family)
MIKAIIFDCFGVLTTEGWQVFKQTHFSNDETKLQEALKLNQLADEGKIDHKQLLPMIADIAGISTEQAHREIDNNKTNIHLIQYIDQMLKGRYKIGMLSNVSDDWLLKMFSSEQLALFDVVALSYDIGHTKPHPRAYLYISDKLGVETAECVFIDDLLHNVEGARRVGMQAVHYTELTELKKELEQLLKMSNSDK